MRVPKTEDCSHYGSVIPELLAYLWRVLPGLVLIGAWYALARRVPPLRIMALIMGFILIRDAMTPAGLWRFGRTDSGVLWVRFTEDVPILLVIGVLAGVLAVALPRLDPELGVLVRWGSLRPVPLLYGLAGGLGAAAPALILLAGTPLGERGGAVPAGVLAVLALFCLAGNLLEEVLFRGFLQGYVEPRLGPVRAALLSAVVFAACHAFLASTVTAVGWPLLLFTLYEGLICAHLRLRHGVLPAALAHGLAILLLASGLP